MIRHETAQSAHASSLVPVQSQSMQIENFPGGAYPQTPLVGCVLHVYLLHHTIALTPPKITLTLTQSIRLEL